MRAHWNQPAQGAPGKETKCQRRKLLFVGHGDIAKNDAVLRLFNEREVRVMGKTTGLLEALERLDAQPIDVILLGSEFREEESTLFVLNAQGRGFAGLVLRVLPTSIELMPSKGKSASGREPDRAFSEDRPQGETTLMQELGRNAAIDDAMPARQADWESAPSSTPLTARQRTVLKRVSDGWTSKQIARSLKCTEGSVKATLQQLFRKLGVRKRALIVRMASEAALKKLYDSELSGLPAGAAPSLPHALAASGEVPAKAISGIEVSEKRVIHAGDFVIDVPQHRAWVRGAEVPFSPTEFKLLAFFSEHPEELLKHESLLGLISGNPAAARESLRVLIRALRAKIETTEPPRYIVTQRNLGYRFVPSPSIGG